MPITNLTVADLIQFENEIAEAFNAGRIAFPTHLESGNEQQLIEVFQRVQPEDWVCASWRSHLKCLLKGVAPETLKAAIFSGESIALRFPESRVHCSAIVAGILPIALGIALGIQRSGAAGRVWCFLGDMTAETGAAHEAMKYGRNHHLPIRWVIEDNGISVLTDTEAVWGGLTDWSDFEHYRYRSKYPHCGAGKRVEF